MSFEQYWSALIKHWRFILVFTIVVGLGAYIGSRLMQPIYQTAAVVQVVIRSGSNQADYNNLLASDELVQTESQLSTSDSVLREVASHYPGMTSDILAHSVTSTPKLNTQLFIITVQDTDPNRGAAIANDVAATLLKQQQQGVQQDNQNSRQQIQTEMNNAQNQINTLDGKIAKLKNQAPTTDTQLQITQLQQQRDTIQQQYSSWQTALSQLAVTQAENGNFLRVAQQATPAPTPSQPNKLLNTLAGTLTGLLLGILLVLLFTQLDTRVRTPEMVSQIMEWPLLATIWRSQPDDVILNPSHYPPNTEAYRILRTNIGLSNIDQPIQTLLVTSSTPGEGKSTVATNLAIFMAKAGKTTLLVDADLRCSTLSKIFDLPKSKPGLSNAVLAFSKMVSPDVVNRGDRFLPSFSPTQPLRAVVASHSANEEKPASRANTSGQSAADLDSFVYPLDIPNLWLMPTGAMPPNPSELLDSRAMQRLLKEIERSGVDMVIFDAPPLLGLSDVSILASKLDSTLVVVDITKANRRYLKHMRSTLVQAGINVLGTVINKQKPTRKDTVAAYYQDQEASDEEFEPEFKRSFTMTDDAKTVERPQRAPEAKTVEKPQRAPEAKKVADMSSITEMPTVPEMPKVSEAHSAPVSTNGTPARQNGSSSQTATPARQNGSSSQTATPARQNGSSSQNEKPTRNPENGQNPAESETTVVGRVPRRPADSSRPVSDQSKKQ